MNKQVSNLEETKSSFYPGGRFQINGEGGDDLYDLDKPEEDHILEGKIDPIEWKQEIDRVYADLDNVEKDLEVIRTRGKNDLTEDFEECRRHIELIIELCKDVKETCHQDVRKVFASAAEALDQELNYIRRNEIRINSNNAGAI